MSNKTFRLLIFALTAAIVFLTVLFACFSQKEVKAIDSSGRCLGVDVSSYNRAIDWNAAKASGIDFAIIRIGFGDDDTKQDDAYAIANMNGCEAAGVPYGVYIYSYAMSEGEVDSEIAHTLRMIQGHNPQLGIWFDMEDADNYKSRHNFNPYTHGAELTSYCIRFVTAMQNAGYRAGVYANRDFFVNVLDYGTIRSSCLIWLAHWGISEPSMGCDMWQYTSSGTVSGIPSTVEGVDMNMIYPGSALYDIVVPEPDNPDDYTPVDTVIRDDGTVICRGDVNGDDAIDVIDLAIVKKHILGKITLQGDSFTLGDVNNDGAIDVIDLALVKKHILGKVDLFAVSQTQQPTTEEETTTAETTPAE
ncbi:MAG: hypothetical protein J5483_07390 [Lachnospiraceae bacterium]|nr:hypothetical protein [Lachnospiraceae bacterium]